MGKHSGWSTLGLLLFLPTTVAMLLAWVWGWAWRWLDQRRGEGQSRRLQQNVNVEFPIPEKAVGFVIGRHGVRVRQVEDQSGARIRVKDKHDSEDKVVVITGKPESVHAAEESIKRTVEERMSEREAGSVTVAVPQHAVGRIIGRQGANIRSLQRQSGARLVVSRGSEESAERTCTVSGSCEEIERAVALLREAIQQSELSRRRHGPRRQWRTETEQALPPCSLPETSDYFKAFVSSVGPSGGVWVQPLEGSDPANLDALVADMTDDYSKLSLQDDRASDVSVGAVLVAPFEHDDSWYRARVMLVDALEGVAELLYVDFGDTGRVELARLKRLRPQYADLPIQAVQCRIAEVKPKGGEWSEDALQELKQLTLCGTWKVVMVKIWDKEGETPAIKIVDTTTDKDVNVAEQLVLLGHATWQRPIPVTFQWVWPAKDVSVAGSFSNWQTVSLEQSGEGVFQCTLEVPEDGCYQYKFLVDGQWMYDSTMPTVEDTFGGLNNVMDTSTQTAA